MDSTESFNRQLAGFTSRMSDSETAVDSIREDIVELKLHVESSKNKSLIMGMQEMMQQQQEMMRAQAQKDRVGEFSAGALPPSKVKDMKQMAKAMRAPMSLFGHDDEEMARLTHKIDQISSQVAKIMSQDKFEWKYPTEIELSTCRKEFRNCYGYSVDFCENHDLFGENRYFGNKKKKEEPVGSKMIMSSDGQLDIVTKTTTPTPMNDVADLIAKEQMEKGEIRLEMNFTPLLAHRYLQIQINEMCKVLYAEKNLNEQFRNEFSVLQSFKFFTEEQLSNVDENMKKNTEILDEIQAQLTDHK